MKKSLLISFIIFLFSCSNAQQVKKLEDIEIKENKTPCAVAYNFITSIISENYGTTIEQITDEYFFNLMPALIIEGLPPSQVFSTPNIIDIRNVMKHGYSVVITKNEPFDSNAYFEDDSNYKGLPAFKVTFACADANNKIYDGSNGDYDAVTTVMLVKKNEVWKVIGFN